MRAVLQRVHRASVEVDDRVVGRIDQGLLALVGAAPDDGDADVEWMSRKIADLRIFADEEGRFNRSAADIGGSILLVSQFTLFADCRKGRRPNFAGAASPDVAAPMIDALAGALRDRGLHTETGEFGAMMNVSLINDGPVTVCLDSKDR